MSDLTSANIINKVANTQRNYPNNGGNYRPIVATFGNDTVIPPKRIGGLIPGLSKVIANLPNTAANIDNGIRNTASSVGTGVDNFLYGTPTDQPTPQSQQDMGAINDRLNAMGSNGTVDTSNNNSGQTVNQVINPVVNPSTNTPITSDTSNTSDNGFDPLKAYRDLALEQAMHSSQGTGIYAMKPGLQYTPEQLMNQRRMADSVYNQALDEYSNLIRNDRFGKKSTEYTPYTGDFANTINLAANNEQSVAGNNRVTTQLANMATNKDYKGLLAGVKSLATQGLPAVNRTELTNAENQVQAADRMAKTLKEYQDMGGDMNYLKGKEDTILSNFGKLATDPKYKSIATELTKAFQTYRQQMTGAAFGVGESREYSSVVPTKDKNIDLNLAIIDGMKNYMNGQIDDYYNTKLGEGYKNLKDLANGVSSGSDTSTTSTTSTNGYTNGGAF